MQHTLLSLPVPCVIFIFLVSTSTQSLMYIEQKTEGARGLCQDLLVIETQHKHRKKNDSDCVVWFMVSKM